jgi:2-amino-4-hydroxy-6-hydroxymethyldihydropteridine diphosphokinase
MAFQWHRSPFALLALIHRIEAAYGRERQVRFGPRTLDIDILAISGLSIKSTELTLPHPRVAERAFVLVPLAEVDVDLAMKFGYVGGYPDEVVKVADFDTVGSRWV